MKFKIGDRVKHIEWNEGIITSIFPHFGYVIRLDKRPPFEYNMGNKEILAFDEDLIELKE